MCDDGQISYPPAPLGIDGSIYIIDELWRSTIGQHTIFSFKITVEDILAGKLVNDETFLNIIVSHHIDQGGGRRANDKI